MKVFVNCCFFLLVQSAFASPHLSDQPDFYYGNLDEISASRSKDRLHHILNSYHISRKNQADIITDFCHEDEIKECYRHKSLGYKTARKHLFGYLHLEGSNGNYYVQSTYCQHTVYDSEFPGGKGLGPMQIPSSEILNTEHAWPQSLFTQDFQKGLQKSDLHALFPVRMSVNSTRGNRPFGYVAEPTANVCDKAAFGVSDMSSETVFEPAHESKGNIARAVFYFATRYNIRLDEDQESTLRQWHELDPVDYEELLRNEEIYLIQFNRNPFIDHPEWVNNVGDF